MKFVLFHGAFGSPEGNWLPELKDKLESLGQDVVVPTFPVDKWEDITEAGPNAKVKYQLLPKWLEVFNIVYKTFKSDEKLCFVGHSLGPLFILHVVNAFNIRLDSAIFISPFLDKLNKVWQIDIVNETFYKTDFDFEKLQKLVPISYTLYSENDPYVDKNHCMLFAKALNSSLIFVKKAGHMNSEVNLNEFPLVLDLCLTRLDLPLYQRYLMLRQKLGAIDYIHSAKGNVVKLNAQDALDEGIFRWRNIQKHGFVTLFTGIASFWDPNSQYMRDARRAAKRVELTRVMVVEKLEDLENPALREIMKLDIEAGIHVFLCMYQDIQDMVPEPDFGVFDDNYVCIVPFDKEKRVVGTIELNSQEEVIRAAGRWRDTILKHAIKVTDIERDLAKLTENHKQV